MSPWIVLVTLAALFFLFLTSLNVARTRGATKIMPPAMTGDPVLERAVRVHGNTLEWIVIFLPCLWLWAAYLDPRVGAALGVLWILGRYIYMQGYMQEPGKRSAGFLVQGVAIIILFFGAVAAAIASLVGHPLPMKWF